MRPPAQQGDGEVAPLAHSHHDHKQKLPPQSSFLVETLSGIDTVKAMAVEPRWQQKWDKQLAAYVSAGLSTTNISLVASGGVTMVSKLVTVGIMWWGPCWWSTTR